MLMEWWILEAKEQCHDVMWFNAESGDIRTMERKDAERLMAKNPGKFKHVDTWHYESQEGQWLKNGSQTQSVGRGH
jgi:predicted GNAT superfamily acetyltransferase